MSLYGDYLAEREGYDIVEDENGFATYIYSPENSECYIRDIYVKPESRKDHIASHYADEITKLAKLNGCTTLSGSVDPRSTGATDSLKVLLAYGFKVHSINGPLVMFVKEI